jgi:hypothetical protein
MLEIFNKLNQGSFMQFFLKILCFICSYLHLSIHIYAMMFTYIHQQSEASPKYCREGEIMYLFIFVYCYFYTPMYILGIHIYCMVYFYGNST